MEFIVKFIELTVHTSTEASELVSDILWNYTDQGVAISDVNDVIELSKLKRNIWDYADDNIYALKDVLVKGYIELENSQEIISQIESDLSVLKENCPFKVGSLETVKREVEGDEWLERWKEHFKPIKIGKVVICPEWITYNAKDGEIVTKIDSNMAFGTGEHETTAMCISLLQEFLQKDKSVIDVGCGSGILGITAIKLGAKDVLMTDIDEYAVEATKHNSKINGVTANVLLKNLLDDETTKGDIILANIMAETLIYFADYIGGNLYENGVIILSGILLTKKRAVISAYEKNGFKLVKDLDKGEWSALAMRK